MENLELAELLETVNYVEILQTINENIITTNELLKKIGDALESYKIAIFLTIFSVAIITALLMFKK